MYESLHDAKSANLPKNIDHLVMKSIYKSCIIPSLNIMIDVAFSVRVPPSDEKDFTDDRLTFLLDDSIDNNFFLTQNNESFSTALKAS